MPQGSVPTRFVLTETSRLELHDILATKSEVYQSALDKATAEGLIHDAWEDLCDRPEGFWDEYAAFIAQHLPEAIPCAVKNGKSRVCADSKGRLIMSLAKAGANVNAVYNDKTALDYAIAVCELIPHVPFSGNRDFIKSIIRELEQLGATSASP